MMMKISFCRDVILSKKEYEKMNLLMKKRNIHEKEKFTFYE